MRITSPSLLFLMENHLPAAVLASLEQPFAGGFCCKRNDDFGVLDPLSPSLLELKSKAAAAAPQQQAPTIDRIRSVLETLEDHFAASSSSSSNSNDCNYSNSNITALSSPATTTTTLIQDLPGEKARCFERSVLFKWLCDELIAQHPPPSSSGGNGGGGDDTARFRLWVGELYTPMEELPIPHAWVDIALDGTAAPATLRVDPTRSAANLEPMFPIDKNSGKPKGDSNVEEDYHPWVAQTVARYVDLGVQPTQGALKAIAAGAATPQALSSAEVFSTAAAILELHKAGARLAPTGKKNEHIVDPLFGELKQRIESGAVDKDETIRPRELLAMRGWLEAVGKRKRRRRQ